MKKPIIALLFTLTATLSYADGMPPPVKHVKHEVKPLQVDPSVAIKLTETPAINLPGVMTITGADPSALDFTRSRTVDFFNGASKTIYLSDHDFNRIQTPFIDPVIIVKKGSITTHNPEHSNNLYVSFNQDNLKPVQIFIENPDGSSMGLQLIPKDIPPQTILIQDTEPSSHSPKGGIPDSYITHIQNVLETVAIGSRPDGFTTIDLRHDISTTPIAYNGLVIQPLKKFSNNDNEIYVYSVSNPTANPVTLHESEFNGKSVAAISIFPKPYLTQGQTTQVIVMTRKATINSLGLIEKEAK